MSTKKTLQQLMGGTSDIKEAFSFSSTVIMPVVATIETALLEKL